MLFPEPPDLFEGRQWGCKGRHAACGLTFFLFYLGAVSDSDMSGYSDREKLTQDESDQ